MIHTVKGFGIVKKAEIDIFLELSCFFDDPVDVGSLICLSLVQNFISEVIDISPGNLYSSLCFFQPSISHGVLCIYKQGDNILP